MCLLSCRPDKPKKFLADLAVRWPGVRHRLAVDANQAAEHVVNLTTALALQPYKAQVSIDQIALQLLCHCCGPNWRVVVTASPEPLLSTILVGLPSNCDLFLLYASCMAECLQMQRACAMQCQLQRCNDAADGAMLPWCGSNIISAI